MGLKVKLLYTSSTSIEWAFSIDNLSFTYVDTSSVAYIEHSKFIGIKNDEMSITAKSLFESDTPVYDITDSLSWNQGTVSPTSNPTSHPTINPTAQPTLNPTWSDPTIYPTLIPTIYPTFIPTYYPSKNPIGAPTNYPTMSPTSDPTFPEGENEVPTTIETTKTNTENVEKEVEAAYRSLDLEILLIVVLLLLCCVAAITCGCILFIKKDIDSQQKNLILKQMDVVPKRLSSYSEENQEIIQNNVNMQIVEGGSCRFYVRAITDWESSEEDQLNLTNDQIFCIVYTTESGWWYGIDKEGNDGWLPSNYVNKLSTNEVEELKRPSSYADDDGDVCIDLLTPQMDQSYNNIQANRCKFDNLPPTIPPIKLTMITAGDDSSSSSSDDYDNQTLGGLNTSF